jgi:1-acyl-sn-glycerol-3-phosphate acyltransferase
MTKRRWDPIYSAALVVGLTLMKVLRVKPTVHGAENLPASGGAVLAITHFGYMDFVLTEWTVWRRNRRHVRFLATKSAFDKPVVGALMRGMHHIAVDMSAGAEAYRNAVDALRNGEMLGVFPEGGVNASYTVRELKTGAVRMAAEAGVPVIPVATWGGHRLLTKTAKSSFGEKFGIPVSFAIGAPIVISATDDVAEVTRRLHDTLQSSIDDLQANYPVDGTGKPWQPAHLGGTAPTPEEAAAVEAARQARKAAARAEATRR